MLEAPIRSRLKRCLTIILLAIAATASLSSCASDRQHTALISDPDSRAESAIPWNKPARWESGANVPGGIGGNTTGGPGDPGL